MNWPVFWSAFWSEFKRLARKILPLSFLFGLWSGVVFGLWVKIGPLAAAIGIAATLLVGAGVVGFLDGYKGRR